MLSLTRRAAAVAARHSRAAASARPAQHRRSLAAAVGSKETSTAQTEPKTSPQGRLRMSERDCGTYTTWWKVMSSDDAASIGKASRHVVVAVDDSDASAKAAAWTAANLARDDTHILLCHVVSFDEVAAIAGIAHPALALPPLSSFDLGPLDVVPPLPPHQGPASFLEYPSGGVDSAVSLSEETRQDIVSKALEQAEDTLVALAQPLVDAGCSNVECAVLVEKTYEATARMVSEVAKEYDAECIVVGSTGKNWLERLFLGSVSNYLITSFPHTVVVVPGGAELVGDKEETTEESLKSGWSDVE